MDEESDSAGLSGPEPDGGDSLPRAMSTGAVTSTTFDRLARATVAVLVVGLVGVLWIGVHVKGHDQPITTVRNAVATPAPRRGHEVTSTSLGITTTIDAVDMVSASDGVALVSNDPFHPSSPVWVVETSDGARTWRFLAPLPARADTAGGSEYIPTIHFVSRDVGYVLGAGQIEMTTNGGLTWRALRSTAPEGWAFGARDVVAVTRLCKSSTDAARCPAIIRAWPWGSARQYWGSPIPLFARVDPQQVAPLAVTQAGDVIVWEGLSGGGGLPGSGALVESKVGTSSWHRLADPCGIESEDDQLIALSRSSWLLSCFLGEGMNSGKSSIWRSGNAGTTWTLVNRATDSVNTRANLGTGGGVAMTIYPSQDGSILYGAMSGAIGGIEVSHDGGAHWASAWLDGQGGAPETVSPIGPRGAMVAIDAGLTYVTRSSQDWAVAPPLPAGDYQGLPFCTTGTVRPTLNPVHVQGIPGYFPVVFTNLGRGRCYLNGTPIVQGIERGRVIGVPATRNVDLPARAVVLNGGGAAASISLGIDLGQSSALGSPATCRPRKVDAIVVEFAPSATFRVKLPHRGVVCAQVPSMGVGFVVKGSAATGS